MVDGPRRESGVVRGIDAEGALLLDVGNVMRRILAGDVSLEGTYD